MLRARWTQGGIEVVDVEPPSLVAGWVRLRVTGCGICGTDLHLWRRELPAPVGGCPGHEIAGVPLDGPAGVPQRVHAVEPTTWCGRCEQCTSGRRNLCSTGGLLGIALPGGLAEWVDAPSECLHTVADGVPAAVASLAEPVAVCVRALRLARLELNSRVLVIGAGTIGLITALLARDRAARTAIVVRHPHQAERARAFGVLAVSEADAAAWARDQAPDVVIETVGGHAETLVQAVRLCRAAGRVVVLGVFSGVAPVDALGLLLKEITLVGSNTYATGRRGSEFRAAVELLPRYTNELASLQTHRFPLARVAEGFATAADKKSRAIKVTIHP